MKGPHPTCPVLHGKLRDMKRVARAVKDEAYRCPDCGKWHLRKRRLVREEIAKLA